MVLIGILLGTKVYATTGKVINDTTRIRKKASTNSDIVEEVTKNSEVEVLSEEGEWYKVKYRTSKGYIEGYIRKDLLEVAGNNSKTAEQENKEENKTETSEQTQEQTEETSTESTDTKSENKEENTEKEDTTKIKENTQVQVTEDTDIRVVPIVFSSKNGKISKDSKVTVSEILGNWCRISQDDKDGWVLKSKLANVAQEQEAKTENKEAEKKEETNKEDQKSQETKQEETKKEEAPKTTTMYVSATSLNLREKAESNAKVIDQLTINNQVTVLEKVDNTWSKVKVNGKTGYVATKYLSTKKTEVSSRSSQETRTNNTNTQETKKEETNKTTQQQSSENKSATTEKKEENKNTSTETKSSSKTTGADIVAYAKKFLGCKYVYGTAGPNTFDCSGLTSYVYKHFGYSLNRTSGGQRSNGKAVSKSDLQAGDILCFNGHVGIYIGGNQFIHAANPSKGVIISSLSESYYVKNYITARRIL